MIIQLAKKFTFMGPERSYPSTPNTIIGSYPEPIQIGSQLHYLNIWRSFEYYSPNYTHVWRLI